MKMAEGPPKGLKTLWEKEKLLVTSNFSFSHSAFKRHVLQTRKNQGLFGKGLNVPQFGVFDFIRPQNECFREYIGISLSVRPSVYKILLSVKALAGVSSYIQ